MAFGGLFDDKVESEGESRSYAFEHAYPGIRSASQLVSGAMDTPLQFYPGQTYAGQTQSEQDAIAALQAGAGAYPGMLGGMMGPATGAWQGALNAPGAALGMGLQDVMNNPALTGAADAIQGRVNRNLQENVLPGMTAQFMGYGGLGGTRQGVAEGIAGRGTSDVLAEQLANMYGNAWAQGLGAETSRYNAGLGAQAGAVGQLPMMADMGLSEYTQPASLLGQAGILERAEEQRGIDEDMARFQFSQTEPYQRAGLGLPLLMGPGQAFGINTTKNETTSKPSAFSSLGQLTSLGGSILGAGFGGGGGGGFLPGFSGGAGGFGFSGGAGLGQLGYGLGYGINPFGQQASMLAGPDGWS